MHSVSLSLSFAKSQINQSNFINVVAKSRNYPSSSPSPRWEPIHHCKSSVNAMSHALYPPLYAKDGDLLPYWVTQVPNMPL